MKHSIIDYFSDKLVWKLAITGLIVSAMLSAVFSGLFMAQFFVSVEESGSGQSIEREIVCTGINAKSKACTGLEAAMIVSFFTVLLFLGEFITPLKYIEHTVIFVLLLSFIGIAVKNLDLDLNTKKVFRTVLIISIIAAVLARIVLSSFMWKLYLP